MTETENMRNNRANVLQSYVLSNSLQSNSLWSYVLPNFSCVLSIALNNYSTCPGNLPSPFSIPTILKIHNFPQITKTSSSNSTEQVVNSLGKKKKTSRLSGINNLKFPFHHLFMPTCSCLFISIAKEAWVLLINHFFILFL